VKVLGICHDVLICSAALVEDGEVLAAAPEERFDRQKQSRVFPTRAIDWVLADAGITMADVDEIAIAWNPSIDLQTLPSGWLDARRHRGEHFTSVPGRLMRNSGGAPSPMVQLRDAYDGAPPITFVNHYDAHIGNSYHLSGWDDAALAVLDGRAERQTSLLASAKGTKIERLQEVSFPHSLGLLYGTITQFLGYRADSDEWKVMAMGSHQDPNNRYLDILRDIVHVRDDGTFRLDLSYFEFYNQFDPRMYSDRFVAEFGTPRRRHDDITDEHELLASACQQIFEEATTKILTSLHAQTGRSRLAVSGGCFMNSVFNGKITEVTPFDEVFISSCPDDSGTSIGAALYLEAERRGSLQRTTPMPHNYWGVGYSDEECLEVVQKCRLPNVTVVDDPAKAAAQDLVDGHLLGWFQGRMEFGQRALGARSILCDPRREDGKAVVNAAVKFREGYRPFAPAILAEKVHEWFECEPGAKVPFMERVYQFRPEQAPKVPAVVHTDGSGRVQTVDAETAERYHAMIAEFDRLTGVPIMLNTSFNLNGEPVVMTPEDAIRTFYTCALDVLYLGNVRIAK
jgi:carbamoyltransferase